MCCMVSSVPAISERGLGTPSWRAGADVSGKAERDNLSSALGLAGSSCFCAHPAASLPGEMRGCALVAADLGGPAQRGAIVHHER